ncbi:hypothetical protein CC78DRAFT_576906 [Lojkania enalia]|uniref:Uncharacterized protein n=1 Tax=Lojkania enalia TaxID=147567 RepID=A0A9P4N7W7_9PLEO|nr:hypothetical protein CC78DRAFT_576906 [Didymosphaeria enalia]
MLPLCIGSPSGDAYRFRLLCGTRRNLGWARIKLVLREPFAEFWDMLITVVFGDGSVAQVLLSAGQPTAPSDNGFGVYQTINWGRGLSIILGTYVAGDSEAYLNPPITFSNRFYLRLSWQRFPIFFMAQFLGGFVEAGIFS